MYSICGKKHEWDGPRNGPCPLVTHVSCRIYWTHFVPKNCPWNVQQLLWFGHRPLGSPALFGSTEIYLDGNSLVPPPNRVFSDFRRQLLAEIMKININYTNHRRSLSALTVVLCLRSPESLESTMPSNRAMRFIDRQFRIQISNMWTVKWLLKWRSDGWLHEERIMKGFTLLRKTVTHNVL